VGTSNVTRRLVRLASQSRSLTFRAAVRRGPFTPHLAVSRLPLPYVVRHPSIHRFNVWDSNPLDLCAARRTSATLRGCTAA